MKNMLSILITLLGLFSISMAQGQENAQQNQSIAGGLHDHHAKPSQAKTDANGGEIAFTKIKSLVGEWHAPEGGSIMINIFRPIAFGSAMIHEEWKDGQQLTATVFYMVGSELRADHFCDYKNQPRYVVKPTSDPTALLFEMRDSTNLDISPRHFHSTTWKFIDDKHLTQDWQVAGGGKDTKYIKLEFTRKK